jgi:hypothetical protein
MKNLIATAGCALVIGLSSTFAQQDSTRDREQARRVKQPNETNRSRNQNTDEARRSGTNPTDQNQSNAKREMVIVQPSEVPSSLRETLADPKYQGWENAIIYHNTRTGEYLVSPRPHRFSSEGKEIGYGMNDDIRGNRYGNNPSQNRSSGSINQHRRTSGNSASGNNSRTNSDDSNASSRTNPNQDSIGMSQRNSSSSQTQDRERSGQSSSYRRDSTDSNNSEGVNSDRTQSDSSRSSATNSNASSGTTSSNNSYTGNRVEDQNLPTEGMVLVEEQDVPAKLKETLRDSDYSGWERGKLYQNPASGEYILIMGGAESGSDEQRSYRFDKDGKIIKDNKMNGRGQE